ncbi:hypothetical protein [Streptomyces fructofermentans]|uniref:Uncharacterized protein n=1 Tax=Streptomyces fructofermentans TaxID=152141 RepID=A0A918U318_9ACTN|nr:hypothetical protein [Streptomyces fructofermentans]GGX84324.1 hypothetical protein GCM10010515_59880 [Streptomyces fructofermentans]
MRIFLAGLACGAASGGLTYHHSGGDGTAAAVLVAVLAWVGICYAVIDLSD